MVHGPEEFSVSCFQEPGRAEPEIEPHVRAWQAGFFAGLSGDAPLPPDCGSLFVVPAVGRISDRFAPGTARPSWFAEADLRFFTAEFERTGMTGALNRYRNVDRDGDVNRLLIDWLRALG